MRRESKQEKLEKLIVINLTYIRLQADALAIEAEIADNQPVALDESQNPFKKFVGKITTGIQNGVRRSSVQELTVEKGATMDAIKAFEEGHTDKQLVLSKSPEKLTAVMQKKLFKKDTYGLKKISFALKYMLGDGNVYARPDESLQVLSEILFDDPNVMGKLQAEFIENFEAVRCNSTVAPALGNAIERGINAVVSFSQSALGATGFRPFVKYARDRKRENTQKLPVTELEGVLALRLTIVQEAKKCLPDGKLNELVEGFLARLSDLRADAEYKRFVEKLDTPTCKTAVATCELCIARLAQILGV